jgi:hypothetical protein
VETRLVPDAPGAWLVYDLGTLVFAVPPEVRAAADAVAATSSLDAGEVLAALRSSGAASFAVLDAAADGLHVALRGTATLAAGVETVTGLGAEPWLERVIPGAAVVRLTVPGGEWTLTLASATSPIPVASAAGDVPHITEVPDTDVPDIEVSLPPAVATTARDDDRTVVVDEIARLRAGRSAGLAPPILAGAAAPPPVPALSLELPDGSREPLDGVVLVGRAPSAPVDAPGSRLLRLAGDGDISRNHARVAVEGGTVIVTDLGSRNGTVVRIPGYPAQKLREGQPTPVLVGTTIDLGGGLELNVRDD